ncbi:hypothetical protein JB92DRAFT_2974954 [Gautieria morchelliformis]|nr:hypothetical protein JB92DRAFT_2974954 [Gautieria morchelliformis]
MNLFFFFSLPCIISSCLACQREFDNMALARLYFLILIFFFRPLTYSWPCCFYTSYHFVVHDTVFDCIFSYIIISGSSFFSKLWSPMRSRGLAHERRYRIT